MIINRHTCCDQDRVALFGHSRRLQKEAKYVTFFGRALSRHVPAPPWPVKSTFVFFSVRNTPSHNTNTKPACFSS